jgi:hypothetical protein
MLVPTVKSIAMCSHSAASIVNPCEPQSSSPCHFLKIPSELRDIIYEILLTTPYCTTFDSEGFLLEFHLHSAILLVNKQVSAEARRVLYQGNDFVILKTTGIRFLHLEEIPAFVRLPESKVTSPVLQVEIAVADDGRDEFVDPRTLITTIEGLQSIIIALWMFRPRSDEYLFHGNLSLSLSYNAVSRYHYMSEIILRPWNRITGLKELVLTGDIEKPMREHLEKSNLEGPFPNEVAMHLAEYHSLAERDFERKDYNSARWWYKLSGEYWKFILYLRPHRLGGSMVWQIGDELWDVLRKSLPIFYEERLKLMKTCLRESKYPAAFDDANQALYGIDASYMECDGPTPIMQMKFHLGACLARTSLGKIQVNDGTLCLDLAAHTLYHWSLDRNMNGLEITEAVITQDLKVAVNNELIRMKSSWRCGHDLPVSPTIGTIKKDMWQVGECQRSFWDWLDLPEEWELAWNTELESDTNI